MKIKKLLIIIVILFIILLCHPIYGIKDIEYVDELEPPDGDTIVDNNKIHIIL